ncbi:hypothetical protein ACT6QH_06035 [Xanthobacter sp. TB0139]|uniref:hypothetical protein n=1 Tax=Xanthobacter sp. TB0139 TaxID=3459178 RepID=UPI0040398F84
MAMQRMKEELARLQAQLSQAAPRRVVAELDHAMTLLSRRLDDLHRAQKQASASSGEQAGPGQAEMGLLASELAVLRETLEDMRAPERFQALSSGVEMLSRKLQMMDAKAVSPVEVARLQARVTELSSLVQRVLSGSGLQELAGRLETCAAQVARAGNEAARQMATATRSFEDHAQALLNRVEHTGREVREAQAASTQAMRQGVKEEVSGLYARLDAVAARIETLAPGAASSAVSAELEERLSVLVDRLGQLEQEQNAPSAALVPVVERHLVTLTQRFQETQAHFGRLNDLELALERVIGELQQVREASAEATAEAVQSVALKVSDAEGGPAVLGLKRGLAALEARQDEVERQASAWLGEPFHETSLILDRTEDGVWAPQMAEGQPGEQGEAAGAPVPPRMSAYDRDGAPVFADEHDEFFARRARPVPEQTDAGHEGDASCDLTDQSVPDEGGTEEPQSFSPHIDSASPTQGGARVSSDLRARLEPDFGRMGPDMASAQQSASHMDSSAAEAQVIAQTDMASSVRPPRKVDWSGRKKLEQPQAKRGGLLNGVLGGWAVRRASRQALMGRRRGGAVRWGGVAASVLVVALASTASFAWLHRDALQARMQAVASGAANGGASGRASDGASEVAALAGQDKKTSLIQQASAIPLEALPAPLGSAVLRADARDGDLAAAYEVGVRYADGVGVKADAEAATHWLRYAAERGLVPAAYRLGTVYEKSFGNEKEAARFYKWAAERGNVQAMHSLAVLMTQGLSGNGPDWAQAIQWFRGAAEHGVQNAQYNLGIIFARGLSGHSDLQHALMWFAIAANQGDEDSADKRDLLARQAEPQVREAALQLADAFQPRPLNETANVVQQKSEWNAPEPAKGRLASTAHSIRDEGELFFAQDIPSGAFSSQPFTTHLVASRQ